MTDKVILDYTSTQINDSFRKTLTPSRLTSYLPSGDTYTTPTLVANTWTKILAPTTVKYIQDFALDVANNRYYFNNAGVINRRFSLNVSISMSSSSSNHLVEISMFKNGVLVEGVYIKRFIAAGADVGAFPVSGAFELSDNDYIEIYVKDASGGTLTFQTLSINIVEDN